FTALIIVPSSIVYYIYVDISATFFIYMIVAFLFIPVIPIILASVIASILSFIATRSQHKNIFIIVLSLAFIVVFMALSAKMKDVINYIVENSSSISEAISKIYPPAFYYSDALKNFSFISLFKMILWAVVPFIIFIFAFAKSYKYINIKIRENHQNLNYKLTDSKVSSKVNAIFKKEFKRYLSSPIYVLNTSLGLLLIIIVAVVSIIMGSDTLIATLTKSSEADLLAMKKTIEGILQYVPLIIISFGVGLSCTTGSAISLEGKNFWILKTSPIKAIDVLKGKIYVNLVLSLSTIIIATLLFDISFNLTFINMIWTILISSLLAVFVAVSGIIINLYFPNLTWTNETKVVKQSISSMLSIFLGLVLVVIIVGLSYVGIKYLQITNITIYLVAITILFLFLDAVSIMVLKNKGTKLFYKLSC
ncbi:MAG: ABC transporter permease, partial [Clostridiaceae bacterium]|nr:ABC transporter permease [Clostridiaceae bacterium]